MEMTRKYKGKGDIHRERRKAIKLHEKAMKIHERAVKIHEMNTKLH